jgi:hypothetical protein
MSFKKSNKKIKKFDSDTIYYLSKNYQIKKNIYIGM